jgi:hypothetical protein
VKQHGYKGAKELTPFAKPSPFQQMANLIWEHLDIRQEGKIATIEPLALWNIREGTEIMEKENLQINSQHDQHGRP